MLALGIDSALDALARSRIPLAAPPPSIYAHYLPPALRFRTPGIRRPIFQAADSPDLDGEMKVLGVSMANHHRAYAVPALSKGPGSHVVNDLIEGTPVSVTFCDMTGCARVFTKADREEELDLDVGGLLGGKMLLLVDGHEFPQDSDDIPLDELPHEETTWNEWKTAHPDAEIYLGASRHTDVESPAD